MKREEGKKRLQINDNIKINKMWLHKKYMEDWKRQSDRLWEGPATGRITKDELWYHK